MELNKIKEISLYVNKTRVDIYSQDALNLRFNNTFPDPTKLKTIQTEYSFSFTLPITPTNSKVFDFAHIPSKRSKFNKRYPATLFVDGILVFDGELIVQSITSEGYKCNLYINKLNTVDTIFGDSVLSDINDWFMEYHQEETINEWNSMENIQYPQDVFFPLVSYGMFQKLPQDNELYTSKFIIDDYNRIYNENFYPSINLLRCVEKCFAYKGYEVQGDIFDDSYMKKIYMSTRLGSEQDPIYNYGDPELGKLELSFTYDSWADVLYEDGGRGNIAYNQASAMSVDLDKPKFKINAINNDGNWSKNNVYDVWASGDEFCTIKTATNQNLWRENRIVVPANGYYKVDLEIAFNLDTSKTFKSVWYKYPSRVSTDYQEVEITPTVNLKNFFVEFQLVKNTEDGTNVKNILPDSVDVSYITTGVNDPTTDPSLIYQKSAYPHTPVGHYTVSTANDPYPAGYIPRNGATLGYDPSVNSNFICGGGFGGDMMYTSFIKNGNGWNGANVAETKSRYLAEPYYGIKVVNVDVPSSEPVEGEGSRRATTKREAEVAKNNYGAQELTSAVSLCECTPTSGHFKIQGIVYLEKNDMIQLKMVQRQWENRDEDTSINGSQGRGESNTILGQQTDAVVHLTSGSVTFECMSPDDIGITNDYLSDYSNPSRFPTDLNIASFLSNEDKMSDFINNFIKEFNLSYSQNGKVITMNKQKVDFKNKYAIDLTDRVNEMELEAIEYPSKMSVEYSINDDERGVYISAERNATEDQIQSTNWRDYADKGYDVIQITEDEYAQEETVSIKTSYNWYEDFKVTMNGQNATITIPIIARDEWMIEGYKDAEMMKNDGLSFNRRYWFPSTLTDTTLTLCNNAERQVKIMLTTNNIDGCELSYKEKENSLLDNYFNLFYDVDTNYCTFETYLSAEDYINIKNGANLIIDDDVYIVIELNGYDCSGNNKTKITAMKK